MSRYRRFAVSHFPILVLLNVALGASAILAQVGTGTILGVVTDSSGAAIAGAAVSVRNTQTDVTVQLTTNGEGRYVAPDLTVGTYDVRVELKGFETQARTGIVLTVGKQLTEDLTLALGQATEVVEVKADAAQVNTTTAEISATIGQEQVEQLPLNGRDYEQLILLAPGVQQVNTGAQTSFYGRAPSYSIAGSRPEGQELLLDGANIQGFWNHGAGNSIIGTSLGVEAIGEFQVLTNSYSARFGGSGSVMNATTRSGTNAFHGSMYEFFRNSALDARDYFNTSPSAKNPFRQNQFGGTLGGPIKKDKMFFFLNYEGIRYVRGFTSIGNVPDAAARQGIVPCAVAPDLPCGANGTASVPLNPASRAILNLYPAAGPGSTELGGGIAQITLQGERPASEDYVNTRWDYNLSSTHSIFARYVFDNGTLTDPFVSPLGLYPEKSNGTDQYFTLGDRKSFSSTLLNDVRVSFVRTNMAAFVTNSNSALAFFAPYNDPRQDGNVGVPGLSPVGPSPFTPDFTIQNTYSVADDVYWTHGKHTVETGLEFRRLQSPLSNDFFDDQGWNFPNFESFLEGKPVSPTDPPITLIGALPHQDYGERSFREWDLFPYIQDTWKVSRTLTLDLGLRYDFISNPTEQHNQLCAFINPSSPSTTGCTPVTHVFPTNPSLKNFDPRVGVAWDPFRDHKTSIRAGVGVFHDPIQVRNYHPAYIFATPFQTAVSVCVFGGPPCSYPTPFQGITAPIPTIGEALEYDPKTTPFVLQYNFGIQRQLSKNTVLSVSYVGSRGYNLLVQNDLNPPIPTTVNGQENFLNAPRNNPNLGAIAFNVPDGRSWYNSLQTYLTRTFSNGLQFQLSYTYSKCIDEGSISYGLEAGNSGQQAQSDPYNLALDKGDCDFDIRHNLTGNTVYVLPFHGNRLVEGWQVSGILIARSGEPFSVQDGFDQVGLNDPAGQPGERPDVAAGRSGNPIIGRVNEWYDPTAFVLQPPGTLGDLGRNTLVGPRFVDVDLSLVKNTKIRENVNVEFRVEAFNLLNHPNFGLPNTILFANSSGAYNPSAGQITSTVGNSRELQLALKFTF